MPANNTVIVICGPTAVGKTSFAIQLAKHFHTQIISADSRQCYKEMTIGVAKPSVQQLAEVHHYFINSHSILQDVNAAVFEQYALKAAEEIFTRNPVTVMVGGTGLYIKAFCEGLDEIPPHDETIRQQINTGYQSQGLAWLQQEVQRYDPVFWEVAEQQNPHRLLRALEVVMTTGKSILAYRKGKKAERAFKEIKIGLELPKEDLHKNINDRVDQMIADGLVEEVRGLLDYRNIKALQTVGYKEIFEYLQGHTSLEEAIQQIKINTRQYAKRQITWFKKDSEVMWSNPSATTFASLLEALNI